MKQIGFADIFDADVHQLLDMRGVEFESDEVLLYANAVAAYLVSDVPRIDTAILGLEKHFPKGIALVCARLRLKIRLSKIDLIEIGTTLERISSDDLWCGEVQFIAGFSYEVLGENTSALSCYEKASASLERIGAKKKSVRALSNSFAALSRLHPERHFIPELHFLIKRASAVGDVTTAAMGMMNLSSEYQKIGALTAAIKFAREAHEVASRNSGDLTYFRTLVHLANLYAANQCLREANECAEIASIAEFAEIKAALEDLKSRFPMVLAQPIESIDPSATTPFWLERKNLQISRQVGSLEERLVEILSQGPKTRDQLCLELYGEKIAQSSAVKRLENLLIRLRRNQPGFVVYVAKHYRLSGPMRPIGERSSG